MMSELSMQAESVSDPTARSAIYRLLSLAFRYPTQKVFESLQDGIFLTVLWENMAMLPHLSGMTGGIASSLKSKAGESLRKTNFRDFEVGYTRTFDVGAPQPPCPPYEGAHREGIERTGLLIEVSEFYKHFGLKTHEEESLRELPDHLCLELEFLHFLTFKEAQAAEEGNRELLDGYILAQKDFLERHMKSWLPAFRDKLQTCSMVDFYTQMAEIVCRFTDLEHEYLRRRLGNGNQGSGQPALESLSAEGTLER